MQCGGGRAGLDVETTAQAVVVDGHDLAGDDITDVLGVDDVERAGLAGKAIGAVGEPTDAQRPDAVRVAGRNHLVGQQEDQAEGALEVAEGLGERVIGVLDLRVGQQVQDDLGVAGGVEDVTLALVLVAKPGGVDQVAIVGDGHLPGGVLGQERLDVLVVRAPVVL